LDLPHPQSFHPELSDDRLRVIAVALLDVRYTTLRESLMSAVSVAATGLVAYRTGVATRRQLGWFDRLGTARGLVGDPDGFVAPAGAQSASKSVLRVLSISGRPLIWECGVARSRTSSIEHTHEIGRIAVYWVSPTMRRFSLAYLVPVTLYNASSCDWRYLSRRIADICSRLPLVGMRPW